MKKFLAILLTLMLVLTLFSACASEEPAPDTGGNDAVGNNVNGNEETDGGDDGGEEEIVELEFWGQMWVEFSEAGGRAVEKAINEITEREIGVHINFNWIKSSDYANQITLAIANSEQIDLASYVYGLKLPVVYANGLAMDITDYVDEYAAETKEMMGWVLDLAKFDGKLYGVPTYRLLNANAYTIFRMDALEKSGVVDLASNMTTWSEMEDVLAAVSEKSGTYALGASGGIQVMWNSSALKQGDVVADTTVRETLGDGYGVIVVEDGVVASAFDNETVVDGYKMIADWYDKGYIYPDSPFSMDSDKVLMSQNVFAGLMTGTEFGAEASYKANVGVDCLCFKMWPNVMNGAAATSIGAFVPVTSQEPEAAVKLINLIWNNAELCSLWAWGIEGEDYVLEDGVAVYPDGKDAGTVAYHTNDYAWGNQFLIHPWDGAVGGSEFRKLAYEDFLAATKSAYLGFSANLSEYADLTAAIASVKAEYIMSIGCGLYTEDLYAEFLEKLDAAGLDEYIGIFQTQLDEFMS